MIFWISESQLAIQFTLYSAYSDDSMCVLYITHTVCVQYTVADVALYKFAVVYSNKFVYQCNASIKLAVYRVSLKYTMCLQVIYSSNQLQLRGIIINLRGSGGLIIDNQSNIEQLLYSEIIFHWL